VIVGLWFVLAGAAWSSHALPVTQPPHRRQLLPVDEGSRDPSWTMFRARLLQALKAHDTDFVASVVDPGIQHSFGPDGSGAESFKRAWKLDRPEQSELWNVLTKALTLGGTFTSPDEFCAPYVYTRFPKDIDGFEYAAILARNVPLYARASARSAVRARLSYDLVRRDSLRDVKDSQGREWAHVTTASGMKGYVGAPDVRSPIDYRACFKRSADGWRMTVLVAGD
jgi:hypothetical protein